MIARLFGTRTSWFGRRADAPAARGCFCSLQRVLWVAALIATQSVTDGTAREWRIVEVVSPGSVNALNAMPVATSCSASSCSTEMAPSEGPLAPAGLPDGHIATGPEGGTIAKAWYAAPTRRYRHAILGDDIEAGRLVVEMRDGARLSLDLPQAQVFEDRTPRLVDLEGFGETHVVTILAEQGLGASVAVFGVKAGGLVLQARSQPIGRANRWLNIAGIADFDGDGRMQIAAVETPHIGGMLKFWTVARDTDGALTLELSASLFGFSNHQIGFREQALSVMEDFDGDGITDLALPDDARRVLRIIGFEGEAEGEKTLREITAIPLPAAIDKAMQVRRQRNRVVVTLGLSDGSVVALVRR